MTAVSGGTSRTELDAAAMLTLVACCALWGGQQVAIKLANAGISPILQGGLRSLGAVLVLWGWAAWRGRPLLVRDGTLGPGLLIGGLFSAEFALVYLGLERTPAARAVLFLYTAPVWVALGAHVFLPGERMNRMQALGLALAFAGLAVAFADALRLPSARELSGDAMMLAAAVLWAATSLAIKATGISRIGAPRVLFYQLAVSAAALPAVSLAAGEPGVTALDRPVVAAMLYQIVIIASASYLVWFWLLARYPAGRLSVFTFLTPLFGLLAGWVLLAEPVTPTLVAAMTLVCLGLVLVNRPGGARKKKPSLEARALRSCTEVTLGSLRSPPRSLSSYSGRKDRGENYSGLR